MLRQTVILIFLAATSLALAQDQPAIFGLQSNLNKYDFRICAINDRGLEAGCHLMTFHQNQCAAQACKTVTITPKSAGNKELPLIFETGSDMICNVWTGTECRGTPTTTAPPNSHKAQIVLQPDNLTMSYNCHNAVGVEEKMEKLSI
jgi:hypothetical protein